MKKNLSTLACAALLTGCGLTTSYTPTNAPPRAMTPRPLESVQIFTASKPTRKFVEVGIVTSRPTGSMSLSQTGDVLTGLRMKGAEVGCDAVLVTGTRSDSYGSAVGGNVTVNEKQEFQAACLVYTE